MQRGVAKINRYRFLNISAAFEAKILKIDEATMNCSTYCSYCNCCVRIVKPLFHLSKHTSKHQCYCSKRPLCKANGLYAKQTAFMQSKRPLCFRFKVNFSPKSVPFTFGERSSNFTSILHAMLRLFIIRKLQNIKPEIGKATIS